MTIRRVGHLDAIKQAGERLHDADAAYQAARAELGRLIREAHDDGVSITRAAEAAQVGRKTAERLSNRED